MHIDDLFFGDTPIERAIFHYKLHTFGEPAALTYWMDFKEDKSDAEVAARFLIDHPITMEEQERFEALTVAEGWGQHIAS